MSAPTLHLLVIGLGSAGKRHARNLRALGCTVSGFDPRADRQEEAAAEGPLESTFGDLNAALAATVYDGFVIASPPSFHVDQIIAAGATGRWILCEKPLSIDAASCRKLQAVGAKVLLGYTYRWWPPVAELRRRLQSGEIGAVRHIRFVMSAHLADWHPWERYQDFFMANKEQGGGALLDESHFLDLLLWISGKPQSVMASVDKISDLDISADDNVDVIASFSNGMKANLHLDLIGRPHQRHIIAVGETGTLMWSYEENAVKLSRTGELNWASQPFTCERNEMFLGTAIELLELIRGNRNAPSCSLEDGIAALEVVDACRQSSAQGQSIRILS
ncbi:Gfo/Idh/MocA family protein [Prosthecobacter sp.]|uniref:Gfo/Idh/MocA family protein n=1 Tax=Prosthecobacter sp. TaxID=1965333 RepID=UPI003784D1CE